MSSLRPIYSSTLTWKDFVRVLSFEELIKKAEKFAGNDPTLLKIIKNKLNDPVFQKNPHDYVMDLIKLYSSTSTYLERGVLNFFLTYINSSYTIEFPRCGEVEEPVQEV